jgi:phage-related tail protein
VATNVGAANTPVRIPRVLGYASGTPGAAHGWAWVGEKGPELVNFRGGESVIPSHVARGYASGTVGDGVIEVHSHVHLDGKEIFKTVQRESVGAQRRSGTNGLNKRYR